MRHVRQGVLREHQETIAAVIDAGETVAAAVEERPVTDAERIRLPLDALLRDRGLLAHLLEMLATGADALDTAVQGNPVAAPPYLVVTSRGPLCRGTLADGRRLLVELSLFAVETRPRRYVFREPDIEDCLQVELQ